MTDAGTWRERFIEFTDVVPANVAKVYIRLILGPNYGGSSGAFRMDNIQIVGRPDELRVTDGQIAAGGYKFHVEGNIYDVDSGLQIDQATMKMANRAGVRNEGKSDIVDGGRGEDTTLRWEIGEFTKSEVTDLVNDSDVGAGLQLSVQVPDADRDRANDTLWLDGNLGRLRVVDDDTERPKLTLGTMKPRSGILAQWRFTSATNGLYPTRGDASVEFSRLMCETLNGAVSTPRFWDVSPEGGTYSVRQSGWHYNTKYWHVEMTPEADMAITNISFRSMINKPNGPTTYHIIKFVNGVSNTWLATGTFNGGAAPETNVWYTSSHSWSSNSPVLIEAGKTTQFRIWGVGGATNSIGTYWAIANLTFQQGVVGTNGVTEVTDEEFTSGSFKLTGNTWDEDSGIRGTNSTETAKRPRYSMNAPNGSVFATNVPFVFDKGFSDDGSVTTEADGKFEAPIPTPSYTNVMLGEYFGTATVWDADDDRTVDDLETRADLALYVVDNDITPPSAVGTIRVNGVAVPPTAPDRNSVLWTNKPEFLITFDSVAVDQEADESVSPKQRAVTGIGEYRVATNDVTSLTPSNRATIGRPYAVAATNGALANYGFEMTGANLGWTMDTLCQLQPLNTGGTNLVKEGFYSLRQAVGGVAYQTIQFENTAHVTPKVSVQGWYQGTAGATFRIDAYRTNNLVTPVATHTVPLDSRTLWSGFGINPALEIGDGTVEVLKVSLIAGNDVTYWDNIRFGVDIGANRPAMRFVADDQNQGLIPQYLFAVDADNNRQGDRLAGEALPFYTAYDVTPPTVVPNLKASTELVDDPTTQFDLDWVSTYVGPDDPGHTRYPQWGGSNRDLLSPWQHYKVYYHVWYPELSTPADFVYTNFIATGAYTNWENVCSTNLVEDPSVHTNYLALTNRLRNKIRLYDLEFDQDYVVVIVGVDKAGNEGPAGATSWATNNTIKFSVTRGWTMPKDEASSAFPDKVFAYTNVDSVAALSWTASGPTNPPLTYPGGSPWQSVTSLYELVRKDYDLVYWDAGRFQESPANKWNLAGSVRTNWFVDDAGLFRPRGQIRFFRASYKDRWRTNRTEIIDGQTVVVPQRPLASEEVYAIHNVILSGGPNYVALHGEPYTNTFASIFGGVENFPGGGTLHPQSGSTVIEFFSPGTNALLSQAFFLNSSNRWMRMDGGGDDVTDTPMPTNFFSRGFSIHLPDPVPEPYAVTNAFDYEQKNPDGTYKQVPAMVWSPIVQVPTNNFMQQIHGGNRRPNILVYNVAALRLPVAAHPSELNLTGFVGGPRGQSDELYTFNTSTKAVRQDVIYCDEQGVWRFVASNSLVPWGYLKPNDIIVIVSRNGGIGTSWAWHYGPGYFYQMPTRWMGH